MIVFIKIRKKKKKLFLLPDNNYPLTTKDYPITDNDKPTSANDKPSFENDFAPAVINYPSPI